MRYLALLLLVSALILTGCFEKKLSTQQDNSGNIVDDTASGTTIIDEPEVTTETGSIEEVSGENIENTGANIDDDTEINTSSSGSLSGSGDQAMIQDVEADLEALFDDLLKDE